jgi:RNA polymerase sigma-54 factor
VDAAPDRAGDAEAEGGDGEAPGEIRGEEFGTTEREDWANGTEADDFDGIGETPAGASAPEGEDGEAQDGRSADTSLHAHLREQLLGMRLSPEDMAALEVLIESLDDDGYLGDSLEEIAQRLGDLMDMPPLPLLAPPAADGSDPDAGDGAPGGADTNRPADTDTDATAPDDEDDDDDGDPLAPPHPRRELLTRLKYALRWLQNLEPAGVGARDLGECLALQLRQLPPSPERALALDICAQHLPLLARKETRRLCAATGADEEALRAAQALIVACEPKPGRAFAPAESNIIVPDVIVRRAGRGLQVTLNPEVMPRLRINDMYVQAVRGPRGSTGGMGPRLQEARWFMKNIQQRFDTILRVSKAIVERQKAFFSHGAIAMKPLVLREIADELGLHESTISRVTTAKYMATLHGTFELKYFFGSSLATEAGGNASSTAVRALIEQLVASEDPARPLSDSQLSDMLGEQGITVARRTVAKYREALKIAPATQRRSI